LNQGSAGVHPDVRLDYVSQRGEQGKIESKLLPGDGRATADLAVAVGFIQLSVARYCARTPAHRD
jgi:hypothetical protein